MSRYAQIFRDGSKVIVDVDEATIRLQFWKNHVSHLVDINHTEAIALKEILENILCGKEYLKHAGMPNYLIENKTTTEPKNRLVNDGISIVRDMLNKIDKTNKDFTRADLDEVEKQRDTLNQDLALERKARETAEMELEEIKKELVAVCERNSYSKATILLNKYRKLQQESEDLKISKDRYF